MPFPLRLRQERAHSGAYRCGWKRSLCYGFSHRALSEYIQSEGYLEREKRYEEMIGEDMQTDYVMLMNDPTREYWKTYEIEYLY